MIGAFDDPMLPLKVILVFRAEGGWHLQTVLCRVDDGYVTYLPPYNEPWSDQGSTDDWHYFSERVLDGRGGNAYTYEVEGFAANIDDDIESVVWARAAEVVVSTGGPLGEVAHTLTFGEGEETVSMPFVVLPDEESDHMLVATDAVSDGPVSVIGNATTSHTEMTFRSVTHWQRDFARCWQLDPGVDHEVIWDGGRVFLTIDAAGSIVRLADHATSAPHIFQQPADPLHFERLDLPAWGRLSGDNEVVRAVSGEEAAWGWAIPSVLRAAAGPAPDARCPAAPREGDEIEAATGYWGSLLHLLLYSFGWARPDRGLRWWYDAEHPTDDHGLRTVADTYLADGQLDWFAAWLWSTPMPLPGTDLMRAETGDVEAVEVDAQWAAAQERTADSTPMPTPISGGSDPLHLQGHVGGPCELSPSPGVLSMASDVPRAALVVEQAVGWYRNLLEVGAELPPDVPWLIDVVIKPVGWVGSFARSASTGLWHAVGEGVHVRGN